MQPERVADEDSLPRVQRWMQAVVEHPGEIDEAVISPEAAREIPPDRLETIVRPSSTLNAVERVGIYHDMYLLRMVEALASDYPALRHHLGEAPFAELVRDYVRDHPSRSYTLNRLGDHLPEFILHRASLAGHVFLHDLARVELATTESFDAEESPVLGEQAVRQIPPEAWAGARLRPAAATRVLALRYAIGPHVEAQKLDRPSPRPRRRASWMALYRTNYSVMRVDLTRAEHDLLRELVAGAPLGEAIEHAVHGLRAARREETIFKWFRSWVARGMFSAVEL